jgi:hypothetical protein
MEEFSMKNKNNTQHTSVDEIIECKEIRILNENNHKKQALTLAATLFLTTTVAVGLSACSSNKANDVDCKKFPEADKCVNQNSYHSNGYAYVPYGGFYTSPYSGSYYGGSGSYSYKNYDKSIGTSKYSSIRAGSSSIGKSGGVTS